MAQTISLPVGVSTFGNSVNNDVVISTLDTTGMISLKTLNNGSWSSWTAGTPDAFQGFVNIKKGLGYVANTNTTKTLNFTGSPLDVNSVTYTPGLSMLAIPFDARVLGDGYIPRIKVSSLKTVASGNWKSWTAGTPDAFQGFTTADKNKGYVVNIETVFNTYLNTDVPNKSEGVRFNTSDINITDGTVTNGVRYTNPNGLGTLSFDSVTFDNTVPTSIMFLSINNLIAKIDFPTELLGKDFFITYNGSTYNSVFTENENYASPTVITSTVNNTALEISYAPIANLNLANVVYKEMIVNVNGIKSVVEFANEYLGTTFRIWKDGKMTTGTFAVGNVTITL